MLDRLAYYIGWTFIITTAWCLATFLSFFLLEKVLKTFKSWGMLTEALMVVAKRRRRSQ